MTRVLLTGASGFIGSHVLRHLMVNTDWHVVAPVSFRHRGQSSRLVSAMEDQVGDRVDIVMHDLTAPLGRADLFKVGECDIVINLASESHVDRSIIAPVSFVENNVALVLNVLEYARLVRPKMLIHMSTDEVYGPADRDEHPLGHAEWSPIIPSNPYSASKAAQEAIAISYWRTYGIPLVIVNAMNLIGEMQDVEKFVPMTIAHLLADDDVTIHVGEDGTPGSRFYQHARNLADAFVWIIHSVAPKMYPQSSRPTRFNVVGEREIDNAEMVHRIADIVGKTPKIRPVKFHTSRPGHDLRYALDGSRLARAGWKAPLTLEESLLRTVEWTLAHPEWLG